MICKFIKKKDIPMVIICFILTMWYVNFKEQYKAWSKEQSFILTMWYVNVYDENGYHDFDISFILTMWYVNWYFELYWV